MSTKTLTTTALLGTCTFSTVVAGLVVLPAAFAPSPTVSNPVPPIVRQVDELTSSALRDPIGTTDHLTDVALSTARTTRDATVHTATTTVAGTESAATSLAGRALTLAGRTIGQAQATVSDTAASARSTALRTAATATALASDAVGEVATIIGATTTYTMSTAGRLATTVITLTDVGANASMQPSSGTGSVLVSCGGIVVARATLAHGSATVGWSEPMTGSHAVTVTYVGDPLHAPTATLL